LTSLLNPSIERGYRRILSGDGCFALVWTAKEVKMRLDGISTVTAIGVASFAIDRIVTAAMFLLSMVGLASEPGTAPAQTLADRRSRLLYYLLSSALVGLFLRSYPEVGILSTLGLVPTSGMQLGLVDRFLTFIVLVGGADRISAFMKPGKDAPDEARPRPLEVTGRLILEEPAAKKATSGS